MYKNIILYLLLSSIIFGFSNQQNQEKISLNNFDWLLGKWKQEREKSVTYESWTRASKITFEGISHTISKVDADTMFSEYLRIVKMGEEIFFIPKVPENKYPIPFKLITLKNNIVTFENLDHDFPQRIIYELENKMKLVAKIEGKENNKKKSIVFEFVRIKKE